MSASKSILSEEDLQSALAELESTGADSEIPSLDDDSAPAAAEPETAAAAEAQAAEESAPKKVVRIAKPAAKPPGGGGVASEPGKPIGAPKPLPALSRKGESSADAPGASGAAPTADAESSADSSAAPGAEASSFEAEVPTAPAKPTRAQRWGVWWQSRAEQLLVETAADQAANDDFSEIDEPKPEEVPPPPVKTAYWPVVALDVLLEWGNRPFRAVPLGVRPVLGILALTTIMMSLVAAVLGPWLVGVRTPMDFLRERVAFVESEGGNFARSDAVLSPKTDLGPVFVEP